MTSTTNNAGKKLQGNSVWRVSFVAAFFVLSVVAVYPAQAATISWITVGNAGNAADQDYGDGTFGAVSTTYRISEYEVTDTQYAEFLNAKAATNGDALALYSTSMDSDARGGITRTGSGTGGDPYVYTVKSGQGNNPVVFVSWYDTLRFSNWLHNGQGSGDTETGAYTLLGGTPTPSNGGTVTRNGGANVFLPSENEWYKAAYYDPRTEAQGGPPGDDNYWLHATQVDSNADIYSDNPASLNTPDDTSVANFFKNDSTANGYDDGYAVSGSTDFPVGNALTDVGAYTLADSFYGTFDQGGNVWEWNEALIGSSRGLRGGSWLSSASSLAASVRNGDDPTEEDIGVGFRVASPFSEPDIVPEPGTAVLGVIGGLLMMLFSRRRVQKRTL